MSDKFLTPEDLEAWNEAAKGCKKLRGSSHIVPGGVGKITLKKLTTQQTTPAHSKSDDYEHHDITSAKVDRHTEKLLKAGDYPIDGRLDLHGCTKAEAYDLLIPFIIQAHEQELRCVLIITGKGLHSPEGETTLRDEVPRWLKKGELAGRIVKYVPAARKHGGEGAMYVLLRRKR